MGFEMANLEVVSNLPASCLAEFITRGRRSPESVLRPYKFRELGEGQARIVFRPPVVTAIRRFFKSGRKVEVIRNAIAEWEQKAEATDKKSVRARHRSNIVGLECFFRRFGDREFELITPMKIGCPIERIVFTATPDLWANVKGEEILIKIGFGKKRRTYYEVILVLMRRAALLSGYKVRKRNAIYLNVLTGEQVTANFTFKQAAVTLSNAAREITRLWPTVSSSPNPPSPFRKRTQTDTISGRF